MNLNGAVEMDSTRKSKDTSKLIADKKRQAATLDLDELEDLAAEWWSFSHELSSKKSYTTRNI